MRRVFYSRFGEANVLEVEKFDQASPGSGEVGIQVVGCGLNPIDFKTRLGHGFVSQQLGDNFHFVPGYDVSGFVDRIGEGVNKNWLGKAVFGMVNFPFAAGGYADSVLAPISDLQAAPHGIPLAHTAALPLASLTAWQALFDIGELQIGERVLILAGAGGVGHIATQLAHWKGAFVGATASQKNLQFLRDCNVDIALDYHNKETSEVVQPWDLVIDLMGGKIGESALYQLADGGRMVTVPTNTAEQVIAKGRQMGKTVLPIKVVPNTEQLKQIAILVDSQKLNVTVSHRYRLENAAEAQRTLETGHVRGKVILEP